MIKIVTQPRRPGKLTSSIHQLIDAYFQANLTVPFEVAIENPALAICLKNIVASNQADPVRVVDLQTDGTTLVITPLVKPISSIDLSKIDFKRRSSGDRDDE